MEKTKEKEFRLLRCVSPQICKEQGQVPSARVLLLG